MTSKLKLCSLSFKEWVDSKLTWSFDRLEFGSFNLLLGDNAQGKTRIFNVLRTLARVHHTGTRMKFGPNELIFEANLHFNNEDDSISYDFRCEWDGIRNTVNYKEIVSKNEKIIFNRLEKILIEETTGKNIENFFIPENAPAISSLTEAKFETIGQIRDFFQRILFLEANRFSGSDLTIEDKAWIIHSKGSNIGSVLANWQQRSPSLYEEVMSVFQECFPFVTDVVWKSTKLGGSSVSARLLFMSEVDVNSEIDQTNWSDGMLRALCLIALPCTRFSQQSAEIIRPSMVCIDEIENGLDFMRLAKILEHYESYSDLLQILISTHSPVACNLVDPSNWRIVRRKGSNVKFFLPQEMDDLDIKRSDLLKDNWEFYSRHVARSKRYRL